MKIILKTLSLIIFVVLNNTAFSSDLILKSDSNSEIIQKKSSWILIQPDNTKTIKELKQEVKTIDEQKIISDKNIDELKKELLVKKFFKVNLTNEQKIWLNILIKEYRKDKEDITNEIIIKSKNLINSDWLKKELLINEKNFYWNLLEYIDITKYDEYIDYIKKNIILINNKSNLNSTSAQKEVILQNKVDKYKEEIQKHNELTNNNTIILLNEKINTVLIKLTKKEKFINLNNDWKIRLFDNLIKSIKSKLSELEKRKDKTKIQIIITQNNDSIINNIELFKKNIGLNIKIN